MVLRESHEINSDALQIDRSTHYEPYYKDIKLMVLCNSSLQQDRLSGLDKYHNNQSFCNISSPLHVLTLHIFPFQKVKVKA